MPATRKARPGGYYPQGWTEPPPPSPEEQAEEERQSEFGQITAGMGMPDPNQGVTKEIFVQMLKSQDVDLQNPQVQAFIESYSGYSDEDASAQEKQEDVTLAQSYVTMMASNPEFQTTPLNATYTQSLKVSGFGTDFAYPAVAPAARGLAEYGKTIESIREQQPPFVTQPETGWLMFPNGVLVDKSNPTPESAVIFKPNSLAPGSSWWYESIQQTWSQDQIATWRKRLASMGYLPQDAVDVKGFDEQLRMALTQFHIYRYYNGGKASPWDASAGQIKPTMTPKDEKATIKNNVRQQFIASIGDEPSDAELESWTRFVLRQATELQRRYMRRGMEESTALSQAVSVASEQAASKLWENPVASMQRENEAENTKLHDGLLRAIAATEGL